MDWLEEDDESYVVLRDKHWMAEKAAAPVESTKEPKFGSGSAPADLIDNERLRHTDRRILSPIDVPLWDRANWRATLFVCFLNAPPILAIAFEDGEAGEAIFRAWKNQWGDEYQDDVLRLALITGVSKRKPAQYAVVIGPNLKRLVEGDKKVTMAISRVLTMSPETSANLSNFVAAYKKVGSFFLAPVQIGTSGEILDMPSPQFAVAKQRLDIREAWQISENDPDIVALSDDEPIIPAGVIDPPVNKALRRIRDLGRRGNRRN